ncbi:MAG: oligosaccharide flippase family protein [Planctomycetota bacterium]|jgi:O-antigen/teichoic acid export membrane protein
MGSGSHDFRLTLGAKIITALTVLSTQSCLAWCLGTSGRGSYAICLVFAAFLSVIFMVACDTASIYFVSSKRFSISEGITYVLIYGLFGSVLAIVAGLILMQFPLPFLNKATATAFYLALATIPAMLFSRIFTRLLTAINQFAWFAAMQVMCELAKLSLVIVFVRFFSWGVNGALLGILTAYSIMMAGTLLLFRLKHGVTLVKPSIKCLREMFHYGVRYHVGQISNHLNFQISPIILALFATKEEVGLFAVALQITVRAMIIPDTLSVVLIPRVSKDQMGKKKLVARCARLTSIVCGILMLILVVFAKPIVAILFSPAFLPAVPLIRILAAGVVVRSSCKVLVPYLIGTNRPGLVSVSVAVGTLVNLAVMLLLLPTMGLKGAALAVMISYLISSAIIAFSFSRFSNLGLAETWYQRRSDWVLLSKPIMWVYLKLIPQKSKDIA